MTEEETLYSLYLLILYLVNIQTVKIFSMFSYPFFFLNYLLLEFLLDVFWSLWVPPSCLFITFSFTLSYVRVNSSLLASNYLIFFLTISRLEFIPFIGIFTKKKRLYFSLPRFLIGIFPIHLFFSSFACFYLKVCCRCLHVCESWYSSWLSWAS